MSIRIVLPRSLVLDSQILLYQFIIQCVHRAGGHRPPAIEQTEPIRDLACKRQFLFDQQHRQSHFAIELADDSADLGNDVRLDALCRLIEDQQARVGDQRAPDCELLLLPPDRSPPRRPSISFNTGNISKMNAGILRCPSRRAGSPINRFSSTLISGKICRPCGT